MVTSGHAEAIRRTIRRGLILIDCAGSDKVLLWQREEAPGPRKSSAHPRIGTQQESVATEPPDLPREATGTRAMDGQGV